MKAEFIEFNGEWHKDCHKCSGHYASDSLEGLLFAFTKDSFKPDGLDAVCKKCRKEYRNNNKGKELSRWRKAVLGNKEAKRNHIIRSMTRRKHGSAKLQSCKMCSEPAEEWHHIEYKTDGAIPLCQKCHESIS